MNVIGILAAAEAATETAEETAQGISALGLDLFAILAQAVTFLVLFWVVKKYALDGIIKKLEQRRKDINRGLHLTAELDREKSALDKRVEQVMKSARHDADMVIAEAQTESGKIIKHAEEAAVRRAEAILREAKGKIERDIAAARQDFKEEMAGLVMQATEAVLYEKLDEQKDRKLVESYLKEAMK